MSKTPFFKEFGALLFGRRAKEKIEAILETERLEDLYEMFAGCFQQKMLEPTDQSTGSRRRKLPLSITFWAFISQALSPRSSCRETVIRIEAWWRWEQLRQAQSLTDSAYCQARARLSLDLLRMILAQVAYHLERNVLKHEKWLQGRPVKVVDGTSFSMPDTADNQAQWPQPSCQKPGCGFPLLQMVGIFSLSSGALTAHAHSNKHTHESLLFTQLHGSLEKGDIMLEDRGFCSYGAICQLLARKVDTVARLHQMRKKDMRQGKSLGRWDRLVTWLKPINRPSGLSREAFAALPKTIQLRMIKLKVSVAGFRSKEITLITTLSDPIVYPADELRQLYLKRWQVELHFAQIKTLLGMDILRCKSPDMVEREMLIHLICYNMVRALMQRSAHLYNQPLERMSFKGTLDTLRSWASVIRASAGKPRKQTELVNRMLLTIASDLLPIRPGRSEPRAKKRRPKNYQLLTSPRYQMGNLPHRNRPCKKHPKSVLS
jgi:Transposase DDE domain/Insertion element 4 transposase N-terminal